MELPGFAVVAFPPGSFTEPHQVTVAATREATERKIFRFGYEADPAGHEIRVMTGETPPRHSIRVTLMVPERFVEALPDGSSPIVYVREVTGGPLERIDEYLPRPSYFDPQRRIVEAEVPLSMFSQYRFAGSYEAVLLIGPGAKT